MDKLLRELQRLDGDLRRSHDNLTDLLRRRAATAPLVEPLKAERAGVEDRGIIYGGVTNPGLVSSRDIHPAGRRSPKQGEGITGRLPSWWPNVATALIAIGMLLVLLSVVTRM